MNKKLYIIGIVSALILFTFSLALSTASAASFNANDIIDDSIYNNTSTMSATQIDTFLNSFPDSCISGNNGFYTPAPTGWSASVNTNNGYTFGANVTAGGAIYDASQIYDVNPQVLLATMQKEQSIVTGTSGCHYTNPDPGEACTYGGGCVFIGMSYACPGGCSTAYSTTNGTGFDGIGNAFSLQLIAATWFLRWAQERSYGILSGYVGCDPGDSAIYYGGPMTEGYRQRSSSSSLTYYDGTDTLSDGNDVTISNGPTAALYDYTPFESGNENFDNIFTNWFGPTLLSDWTWQYEGQNIYTDSTETTPVSGNNIIAGKRYYLTLSALNTGTATWQQYSVNLGTSNPDNRESAFYDSTWMSPSRPATLQQTSVAPGSTGTFGFWVTAPLGLNSGGTYKEYFNLVDDGVTWMNDPGLYWQFNVQPVTYSWQYEGQGAYTDQTESTPASLTDLSPGSRYYLTLSALNTGTATWQQYSVNLGTSNPDNRESAFYDSTWMSPSRPATLQQTSVAPGSTGTFGFWVTAPLGLNSGGTYKEYFNLVDDGVTWMNDPGLYWQFNENNPIYTWSLVSQSLYTDQTETDEISGSDLNPSTRYYVSIVAKNTGTVIWNKYETNLGTSNPDNRTSPFYDSSWLSAARPATMQQTTIYPGQNAIFNFWITTPAIANAYKEYYNIVEDGVTWLYDIGLYYDFGVN